MTGGYSTPPTVHSSSISSPKPKLLSPAKGTCCVATTMRSLGLEWVKTGRLGRIFRRLWRVSLLPVSRRGSRNGADDRSKRHYDMKTPLGIHRQRFHLLGA